MHASPYRGTATGVHVTVHVFVGNPSCYQGYAACMQEGLVAYLIV